MKNKLILKQNNILILNLKKIKKLLLRFLLITINENNKFTFEIVLKYDEELDLDSYNYNYILNSINHHH